MTFSGFDIAATLVVLVAAFGYVNHRLLRLPQSVAMTAMGAVVSLLVVLFDRLNPAAGLSGHAAAFLGGVDFETTLLDGMLSFLLFAGALHVDWHELRRGRWPILVLSTIGVLLSTVLVGGGSYLLTQLLGVPVPMIWCLVFGALISPTDPVAVMAVLKRTNCSPTLQATVAGESLFNDGVGVVVFSILLTVAASGADFTVPHFLEAFFVEAGGGVLLGLLVGWIGFVAMRSIDEYNVELMITLAIVMGGYALGDWLGVSGPVAMAVAGLLIGNAGVAYAMSDVTRDHVLKFWALVDELLNAVLFLLIGLEIIAISPSPTLLLLGALAIPVLLVARFLSVAVPLALIRSLPERPARVTLVWGGLRGGISVALALSLTAEPARTAILTVTYLVVLFSVLVQGATIGPVLKRLDGDCDPD
ncbi:sodium:proton antiporter [Sphingomonas sp. BN140010]|uniref:Sodium:proton antiporter n=1 Tax=Sphingomonas arvum TaxID=2992113 RepID=A0ABT3JBA1_9SPHN|nr:sodium:proton antiporter [Sphingomonas sp. BN140010]MCW3796219.1 sodium:proton antiporter [Sphingomonas sp. BN140010]